MNVFYKITFLILSLLCSGYTRGDAQTMGGIGATLVLDTAKDATTLPRIKALIPNSPAAAQALPEGAYIIQVNDFECKNKTLEEVVAIIRGEVGTSVSLSLADNPQGKKAKTYKIVRAAIQIVNTPPADPVDAFNAACEQEVKRLKKQRFAVIKTFSSECGDYFFNFEAGDAVYRVKMMILEMKNTGTYAKGFDAAANLFDNSNEANTVALKQTAATDNGNNIVSTLEGSITLKHNSVGVVNTKINTLTSTATCRAMYIVVYQ